MKSSRLIVFAARWAIMSGLAGTVFAVLVFTDRETAGEGRRGMLLAAATFLSIAFILAPFVRNAFVGRPRPQPAPTRHKTLLDEMREGGAESAEASAPVEVRGEEKPTLLLFRLLISLYVIFGVALAAVLWAL